MLSDLELSSATLADGVESRLLSYIRDASLVPGDALPREEDLAAGLRVSRHVVREGVSRLKALGLVESRKRRGTVLRSPNAFNGLQKLAEADLFSLTEQQEFMELRVALELGMCSYIFMRKTPAKLARLRSLAGVPDSSVQEYGIELDFHSYLMEIGGNKIASQFRSILEEAFKPLYGRTAPIDEVLKTPTHHEICDVLEQGGAEDFHGIMLKHFTRYMTTKHTRPRPKSPLTTKGTKDTKKRKLIKQANCNCKISNNLFLSQQSKNPMK
ncbi:MAG: GntR family transcriptional regulator [Lentisphaeria bacterium]|nr:GntR family transcriptional regulator [Lentisphaeria bacterium]